eukprot:NODE_6096_length_531_cov_91.238589_g5339_i0.p2 GENE.NODE_6096_length_531_cov_91.238589_g5339_i0~~NODE_6096_length_531_cov_91.238589_g5339_i0.p2  ORF type:complete len:63 (-),score=2.23 NODE_6096_length_531_cov_91.238589_g5339_i0:131-319(-)
MTSNRKLSRDGPPEMADPRKRHDKNQDECMTQPNHQSHRIFQRYAASLPTSISRITSIDQRL